MDSDIFAQYKSHDSSIKISFWNCNSYSLITYDIYTDKLANNQIKKYPSCENETNEIRKNKLNMP